MRAVQLEKHRAGCYGPQAVAAGYWDHPWVLPQGEWLRLDRRGRKHKTARTEFLVFRCNDPECKARIALLMEDVEKALRDALLCVGEEEESNG